MKIAYNKIGVKNRYNVTSKLIYSLGLPYAITQHSKILYQSNNGNHKTVKFRLINSVDFLCVLNRRPLII